MELIFKYTNCIYVRADVCYLWISQWMQEGIWTSKADQWTLDASYTPTPPECCDLQLKLWQYIRFWQMCLEQANAPAQQPAPIIFLKDLCLNAFSSDVCISLPQLFEMAVWGNIESHFWAFNIQGNMGSKLEHLTKKNSYAHFSMEFEIEKNT